MNEVKIRKVSNGYVVQGASYDSEDVYVTLDDVMEDLLMRFEGRYPDAGGECYGRVTIDRTEPAAPAGRTDHGEQ
jgi:hypothetical protein